MHYNQILQRIAEGPLSSYASEAKHWLLPAVRVQQTPICFNDVPIGASRVGGLPDAPADFEWPLFDGKPLAFVAQYNLEEAMQAYYMPDAYPGQMSLDIAAERVQHPVALQGALPSRGMLYVFLSADTIPDGSSPQGRGQWRVLYYEDDQSLRHVPPPPSLTFCRVPQRLHFERVWMLPTEFAEAIYDMPLTHEERQAYVDLIANLYPDNHADCKRHHLAGHPYPVQEEGMEFTCQLAANGVNCHYRCDYYSDKARLLYPHASQWQLLLQYSGDCGCDFYFWIERAALQACQFDNVWMISQCE